MAGIRDLARRLVSSREDERNMTQTTLAVEGMSCGHCKAAVEGELGKLTGVERSEADFDKNTVEVRYGEGARDGLRPKRSRRESRLQGGRVTFPVPQRRIRARRTTANV